MRENFNIHFVKIKRTTKHYCIRMQKMLLEKKDPVIQQYVRT